MPKTLSPTQARAYLALLCEAVFSCSLEQYEHETGQPLTFGALREEMERYAR